MKVINSATKRKQKITIIISIIFLLLLIIFTIKNWFLLRNIPLILKSDYIVKAKVEKIELSTNTVSLKVEEIVKGPENLKTINLKYPMNLDTYPPLPVFRDNESVLVFVDAKRGMRPLEKYTISKEVILGSDINVRNLINGIRILNIFL